MSGQSRQFCAPQSRDLLTGWRVSAGPEKPGDPPFPPGVNHGDNGRQRQKKVRTLLYHGAVGWGNERSSGRYRASGTGLRVSQLRRKALTL